MKLPHMNVLGLLLILCGHMNALDMLYPDGDGKCILGGFEIFKSYFGGHIMGIKKNNWCWYAMQKYVSGLFDSLFTSVYIICASFL